MSFDLRLGRYQDALADVREVGAVITDGPYSPRTQDGHDAGADMATRLGKRRGAAKRSDGRKDPARSRRAITYAAWTAKEVDELIDSWAPRNRGWFVCFSDHALCSAYQAAYERHGLTTFAPVGVLLPGMTVRMAGDGPSSWMVYANVARPKALAKWGTLPGGYTGPVGERVHIGGKPLWLMQAIVRDYSRPGDLICDPCSGAATTLLAAGIEGRRAIGAEMDQATFEIAQERLRKGFTPSLFPAAPPRIAPTTQTVFALGGSADE